MKFQKLTAPEVTTTNSSSEDGVSGPSSESQYVALHTQTMPSGNDRGIHGLDAPIVIHINNIRFLPYYNLIAISLVPVGNTANEAKTATVESTTKLYFKTIFARLKICTELPTILGCLLFSRTQENYV